MIPITLSCRLFQADRLGKVRQAARRAPMSASKTHSAAGVGSPFSRASLAAEDLFPLTRPQRRRSGGRAGAGRARSVIRPGGAGALVAAGVVIVPARCEEPLHRSMERLTFSGSRLQGGGHLAAGVRGPTAPAGYVAGWRWTCPRFGEALHHITRCIILRWSFSGRYRPCRRTPHRGVRQDQAALCDTSVM